WTGEAEAAYQRLARRCEKVVVGGLSMGGSLALWTALEHPEVAGIICINPATQPQPAEVIDAIQSTLAEGVDEFPGIGSEIAGPGGGGRGCATRPLRAR